jgi:hypothetical protein
MSAATPKGAAMHKGAATFGRISAQPLGLVARGVWRQTPKMNGHHARETSRTEPGLQANWRIFQTLTRKSLPATSLDPTFGRRRGL